MHRPFRVLSLVAIAVVLNFGLTPQPSQADCYNVKQVLYSLALGKEYSTQGTIVQGPTPSGGRLYITVVNEGVTYRWDVTDYVRVHPDDNLAANEQYTFKVTPTDTLEALGPIDQGTPGQQKGKDDSGSEEEQQQEC